MTVNALKHKPEGKCSPAYNIKRPKRGEVAYFPSYAPGETDQTLETVTLKLLADVNKRHNREMVRAKMERTYAFRRYEIIHGAPMISDLKIRWPALFHANEVVN